MSLEAKALVDAMLEVLFAGMQFIELDYRSIRCLCKFLVGHTEITTVNVCQIACGCGHWIMSLFLTPDFQIIFGGTYFLAVEQILMA